MTRTLLLALLLLSGCAAPRPAEFPGAFGILGGKGGKLGKLSSSSQIAPVHLPDAASVLIRVTDHQLREAERLRRTGHPGRAINLLIRLREGLPKAGVVALFRHRIEAELKACLAGPIPLEPRLIELAEPKPPAGLFRGGVGAIKKQVGP